MAAVSAWAGGYTLTVGVSLSSALVWWECLSIAAGRELQCAQHTILRPHTTMQHINSFCDLFTARVPFDSPSTALAPEFRPRAVGISVSTAPWRVPSALLELSVT